MRTPLRLGAVIALGALLLVGMLASPALAWDWGVKAEAVCDDDGTILVNWTAFSGEGDAVGHVKVVAVVNGEPLGEPVEGDFGPDSSEVSGSFSVPLDTESVLVVAAVKWEGQDKKEFKKAHVDLPTDCETPPTTSTTTTTTTPPESSVGQETSTTEGGALPFTGNSSGPMLLASIGLVGGGFVILWVSRTRGRHAAK